MKDTYIKIRIEEEKKKRWITRADEGGITLTRLIIDAVEGDKVDKIVQVKKWVGPQFKDTKLNKKLNGK